MPIPDFDFGSLLGDEITVRFSESSRLQFRAATSEEHLDVPLLMQNKTKVPDGVKADRVLLVDVIEFGIFRALGTSPRFVANISLKLIDRNGKSIWSGSSRGGEDERNVQYHLQAFHGRPQREEERLSSLLRPPTTSASRTLAQVCWAGVLMAMTLVAAVPVTAATFTVNTTLDAVDAVPGNGVCATVGGVCTLRAAVQEANALVGAQTITLPAGVFTLTIAGRDETNAATGDLNIRPGRNISVNGAGAATTIIDANGIDRAFESSGGSLTLNDLTVQNGDAANFAGGCLYVSSGTLTLNRAVVKAGRSAFGGGIFVVASTLTLTDTTIAENMTGGGVYVSVGTTATMNRTTISGNSAGLGGGISVTGSVQNPSTVVLTNTTISGNRGTSRSSALFINGRSGTVVTLTNVTIASNSSASFAGAVEVFFESRLQVRNTIIANNTGSSSTNCLVSSGGLITDLGNNLEFPGTTCGFGLPSDRRADPLLGPLANNGGRTDTHALTSGSPAIDAGDDATCAAALLAGVDQRGFSRTVGARCDMGAFEFGSSPAPAPGEPVSLTASASGPSVTLSWLAPTTGGSPTSYTIEAGSAPGLSNLASFPTGNTATSFSVFGVAIGTYYVRVRATNSAGISPPSNEALLVVGGGCAAPPTPPTLAFALNGATLTLSWSGASGGVTSYLIEAGSRFGASDIVNTDLQSAATTLTANVGRGTYYIRVRARNACGIGSPSNEVILVVP